MDTHMFLYRNIKLSTISGKKKEKKKSSIIWSCEFLLLKVFIFFDIILLILLTNLSGSYKTYHVRILRNYHAKTIPVSTHNMFLSKNSKMFL